MNNRVLLGMSGGVDSSVAAILLKEGGFDVIGVTFIFSGSNNDANKLSNDAKTLAQALNIKHLTLDLRETFNDTVIKYFKEEYVKGKTPFPCAYCNPKMKFSSLEKIANEENCSYIATGHYARIKKIRKQNFIFQGVDPDKDQSFFLWGLERKLIDKLIFPLGDYTKNEIRDIAKNRGFQSLSEKKDSLGICFIEGNNYRKYLEIEGIKSSPGNFVDNEGRILGLHAGIINYTIGQRRGLGIQMNFPVFVAEIRLDENEIVLSKYDDLYKDKLYLKSVYLTEKQEIRVINDISVKVRYRLQKPSVICIFWINQGLWSNYWNLKP